MASAWGRTKSDQTFLLLGESGAGKSTFINAFVLSLRYDTLAEAEKADQLVFPIAATVTLNKSNPGGTITYGTISSGKDENEQYERLGHSVTLRPRIYSITHGSKIINIVDTPGMNDTKNEGEKMEVDDMNIDRIIAKLAELKRLDAVLILLKPKEARLSKSFVNLFKKILSNLSSDISSNVLFVITNANDCMFKLENCPSITMMNNLFREKNLKGIKATGNNVLFVDNMAVPYLIRLKNGCSVEDERPWVDSSWNFSASAFLKLHGTARTLIPIEIEALRALNNATRVIDCITDPLLEVTIDIGLYEGKLALSIKKLNQVTATLSKASPDEAGNSIQQLIELLRNKPYKTVRTKQDHDSLVCHMCNVSRHNCSLPRVCQERVTFAMFPKHCLVMSSGVCQHPSCCKHEAKHHEIVNFSYSEQPEEQTDQEKAVLATLTKMTEASNDAAGNAVKIGKKEIEEFEKKCKEARSVQNKMLAGAAKLAIFQRENSLASDELQEDVISMSLDENISAYEKLKGQELKLKVLREVKEKYESALWTERSRRNRLQVSDVYDLIDTLYRMPQYGEKLRIAADSRRRVAEEINESKSDSVAIKVADGVSRVFRQVFK